MVKEGERSSFLKLRDDILKVIPKKEVSNCEYIKSFEKVQCLAILKQNHPNRIILSDLEGYLEIYKDKHFVTLDRFFKKVHKIIREEAEKSKFFTQNLETLILNNYNANSGHYFGKEEAIKAYNATLDQYTFWEGYWSLISTKNGLIRACYLSDTADREYFYEALKGKRKTRTWFG